MAKKNIKKSRLSPSKGSRQINTKSGDLGVLPKESKKGSYLFSIALIVVVVALTLGLVYMYRINQSLRQPEVQSELAKQANNKLLDRVSEIILVPTDEEPTIAKIVNVANLQKTNADFYKDARDGDRLIIYSSKAIIYRESENKVINVAPVVIKPGDQPGLQKSNDQNTDNSLNTDNTLDSANSSGNSSSGL